jgi:hypothetical protein
MKNIFFFIILLFPLYSVAQDTAAVTKPGKADGPIAEGKFSKDGGSLVSADGKLELKIPEGALSKKTTISIQPVTNVAPNGNGAAYRLEPSGIKFEKPLQIIFHYDEDESKDSAQLMMGICMQDNTGQWYGLKKFTLDTLAKTISGNINHFSDWSKFDAIKLYPSAKRLKVKKELQMEIDLVSSEDEDLSALYADDLAPLKVRKIPWTSVWKANEITNGNSSVGTITVFSKTNSMYKAPSTVPSKNPVAVTADLKGLNYKFKGMLFKDLTLVSNVLVYDNAYEVKMFTSIDSYAGSVLGTVKYKDTGSFVVSLNGKDSRIVEKVNKNMNSELGYTGKCIIVLLKEGWGNIHVAGARSIKVTPGATPDKPATVEISFIPVPIMMPVLQFSCPKTPVWNNGAANGMLAVASAYPQFIKFTALEGEQTIFERGSPGGELYVKITVEQVKED